VEIGGELKRGGKAEERFAECGDRERDSRVGVGAVKPDF
jgi:hypothetical protein